MPRSGPHRYTAYDRAHKGDTADRMAARRYMLKKLGNIPAGMDVDHIKSIKGGGAGRAHSNLRLRDASANRGDKTF